MAVVDQLNLNVGTEQNPNFVLHDINDKRISTTAVTTATHLLTCNSGVTSIAPITAANLASVLGGLIFKGASTIPSNSNLNDFYKAGSYQCAMTTAQTLQNCPYSNAGIMLIVITRYTNGDMSQQLLFGDPNNIYSRTKNNDNWGGWKKFALTSV